jgi:hypothetical protein
MFFVEPEINVVKKKKKITVMILANMSKGKGHKKNVNVIARSRVRFPLGAPKFVKSKII